MPKIIVANWKMNGDLSFIKDYFNTFSLPKNKNGDLKVIFCPPFPYLSHVQETLPPSCVLGGQDCHFLPSGAFTGETSPLMLKDMGCQYVILGHSERRQFYGETNESVKKKATLALEYDLTPLICVGESLKDRESKNHLQVIKEQLAQSLPKTNQAFLIAYEPIWAIGTGLTPTLEEITEIHEMIASYTQNKCVYGGSVTVKNAEKILTLPHVNGLLVGGASLDAKGFSKIIEIGNRVYE